MECSRPVALLRTLAWSGGHLVWGSVFFGLSVAARFLARRRGTGVKLHSHHARRCNARAAIGEALALTRLQDWYTPPKERPRRRNHQPSNSRIRTQARQRSAGCLSWRPHLGLARARPAVPCCRRCPLRLPPRPRGIQSFTRGAGQKNQARFLGGCTPRPESNRAADVLLG
jgi:hypothetical protein